MSQLETFVRDHRREIDAFTPSQNVWSGIEQALNPETHVQSLRTWLPYVAAGILIVAIPAYFLFQQPVETIQPAPATDIPVDPPAAPYRVEELTSANSPAPRNNQKMTSAPFHHEERVNNQTESDFNQRPESPAHEDKKTVSPYSVHLCERLNSEAWDYAPTLLDETGNTLIFASNRPSDDRNTHLYHASLRDGKWTIPSQMDKASGKANVAVLTIDKKRNIVLFTQCKVVKNANSKCGISYSFLNGQMVGEPIEIEFEKPAGNHNYGHPFYANELDVLFFSSDMPGGFGGLDIWYMRYDAKTDSWGKPVNVGKEINTGLDDAFPVTRNGALYFSSAGHGGFGKWDILRAEKLQGLEWAHPENVGAPINSEGDDFGITFRKDGTGFFSSNRKGGIGEDDIYEFRLPEKNHPSSQPVAQQPVLTEAADPTISMLDAVLNKESCAEPPETFQISASKLYPNPTAGEFSLEFILNKDAELTIRMFSSTGQLVSTETIVTKKGFFRKEFILNKIIPGIYYVQILQNCIPIHSEKLIVR